MYGHRGYGHHTPLEAELLRERAEERYLAEEIVEEEIALDLVEDVDPFYDPFIGDDGFGFNNDPW